LSLARARRLLVGCGIVSPFWTATYTFVADVW
jgi:hypothetical protein